MHGTAGLQFCVRSRRTVLTRIYRLPHVITILSTEHNSFDAVFGQYALSGHIVQSFGFVDPAVRATVPKGQFWHTVCPVWLLYLPAGHNSFDAVFGQYAPFGHIVQSFGFVDPAVRATVPKGQFWHTVCPFGCCTFQQGTIVSMPYLGNTHLSSILCNH